MSDKDRLSGVERQIHGLSGRMARLEGAFADLHHHLTQQAHLAGTPPPPAAPPAILEGTALNNPPPDAAADAVNALMGQPDTPAQSAPAAEPTADPAAETGATSAP